VIRDHRRCKDSSSSVNIFVVNSIRIGLPGGSLVLDGTAVRSSANLAGFH
jgi:hypothetical protein